MHSMADFVDGLRGTRLLLTLRKAGGQCSGVEKAVGIKAAMIVFVRKGGR